ncbi:MAG: hypothetical protein ACOCQR_02825 [bacterium]
MKDLKMNLNEEVDLITEIGLKLIKETRNFTKQLNIPQHFQKEFESAEKKYVRSLKKLQKRPNKRLIRKVNQLEEKYNDTVDRLYNFKLSSV